MKKIILSICLFTAIFLSPGLKAQAYDSLTYPGSALNPLQVEIVPNPLDEMIKRSDLKQTQNQQQENFLKSTYGLNNYYNCYEHASRTSSGFCGTYEPSNQALCLIVVQSCLESQARSQSRSSQQINCPSGTGLKNGTCMSYDQICVNDLGQNFKWDGTKNDRRLNCGCKDGYVSNSGQCVSYDQDCNLSYPNTVFSKIDDVSKKRICDCKTGYAWNEQRTSCIVASEQNQGITLEKFRTEVAALSVILQELDGTPVITTDNYTFDELKSAFDSLQKRIAVLEKKIATTKTNNQICSDDYPNSIFTVLNDQGGPTCDCKTGYQWNQARTACVVVPKPKATVALPKIKKEIKTETALPIKSEQPKSVDPVVSDKTKENNLSAVLLSQDTSTTASKEEVKNNVIEQKPKTSWIGKIFSWITNRLKIFTGKQEDPILQETINTNDISASVAIVPVASVSASTSISFIGLYEGAGLVRSCPSFDCKIIKYGAICPFTEVLSKKDDWYKVKFIEMGVSVSEANVVKEEKCGEGSGKLLPKDSWNTTEGWMPSQVIPPQIRQRFN